MEITVYTITALITSILTYIFGFLSKKFGWIEKSYIPIQNAFVGIIAGFICYAMQIDGMDLITSLIVCLSSAFAAGGAYDLTRTGK